MTRGLALAAGGLVAGCLAPNYFPVPAGLKTLRVPAGGIYHTFSYEWEPAVEDAVLLENGKKVLIGQGLDVVIWKTEVP